MTLNLNTETVLNSSVDKPQSLIIDIKEFNTMVNSILDSDSKEQLILNKALTSIEDIESGWTDKAKILTEKELFDELDYL